MTIVTCKISKSDRLENIWSRQLARAKSCHARHIIIACGWLLYLLSGSFSSNHNHKHLQPHHADDTASAIVLVVGGVGSTKWHRRQWCGWLLLYLLLYLLFTYSSSSNHQQLLLSPPPPTTASLLGYCTSCLCWRRRSTEYYQWMMLLVVLLVVGASLIGVGWLICYNHVLLLYRSPTGGRCAVMVYVILFDGTSWCANKSWSSPI